MMMIVVELLQFFDSWTRPSCVFLSRSKVLFPSNTSNPYATNRREKSLFPRGYFAARLTGVDGLQRIVIFSSRKKPKTRLGLHCLLVRTCQSIYIIFERKMFRQILLAAFVAMMAVGHVSAAAGEDCEGTSPNASRSILVTCWIGESRLCHDDVDLVLYSTTRMAWPLFD